MSMSYLEFKSMLETFGIADKNFIAPLYSQLVNADGFGGDGVEFAAAVIKGGAPNDVFEVMQAAQMGLVHWAAMQYLRQVAEERGGGNQELEHIIRRATFDHSSCEFDSIATEAVRVDELRI